MFKVLKTDGVARRGEFHTPHGVIQSPFFMNVGTSAAIKGGISSLDLKDLKCQVELCNTYHLHLRPGDDVIHKLGDFTPSLGGKGQSLQIAADSKFSVCQSSAIFGRKV